ncbi:MAG: DNA recombination protein RmuC [Fimbriimonadaceae bacterium]
MEALWVCVGVVLGGVGVWLLVRARLNDTARLAEAREELSAAKVQAERARQLEAELRESGTELADLRAARAATESRYEEQEKHIERQRELLVEAEQKLTDTFKALSADTLKESRDELRKEAEEVLKPMRDRLEELQRANEAMEQKRSVAYGDIKSQIESLAKQQAGFQQATATLARALQDTGTAGNWGEMVLERVLEMGGLNKGIHFETQATTADEDGNVRPDVIVKLPGDRTIVIDSKAPMRAYLASLEDGTEAERAAHLATHASKLLGHARALGSKGYARRSDTTDFVVLFVPSEAAFRAAFEHRPGIVEEALRINVFISTPTTLLALLRAVSYGWRQEQATREARKIQEAGQKLYESIATVVAHYEKLGRGLRQAVGAYNDLGGSLASRALPRARQMKELGVQGDSELAEPASIEFAPRPVEPPEDARPHADDQGALIE